MPPIHAKTAGASLGAAAGLLIVSILGSIHGVHLTPEANAAIPSFLAALTSWLVPSATAPVAVPPAPAKPATPVA